MSYHRDVAPDHLEFLVSRRSATSLGAPGPTREELARVLAAAGAVPDHGLLRPFRFVVAEGDGRAQFGDALAKAAAERNPAMSPSTLEKVRAKAFRSPTVVVLISSPKPGKIERWEQIATAACAGYAIVLAAHALGIGAVWKSVPFTKGVALTETLGLAVDEEVLGWIHLGRPTREEVPPSRAPLDLASMTTVLDGSARVPYRT